jgi:dienelactone hydrolase
MSDSLKKRGTAKGWKLSIAVGIAIVGLSMLGICFAQEAGLDARLNEQIVMIPSGFGAGTVELETTVFKPPGNGPFPLIVMNHGKEPGNPHFQKRDRFIYLSREFVKRGYAVVLPMRKGFAKSTGEYMDFGCNMAGNGQLQANDLQGALDYLRRQPWVDKDRIVVAGQSYGGLATIALGTRNVPGVRGLINFAGGLRTDGGDCQWQASLVDAFAEYGMKSSVPSLWFYGENDSYFNHDLASRLFNAYTAGGGNAELVAYGSFKSDAHSMAGSRDGVKVWLPETEKFLQKIGMPTQEVVAIAEDAPIPKSNFAALDDVEAIPYLKEKGRDAYRAFLARSTPKAFAVSPTGAWSWAEEGDDPVERVLASCQSVSRQPCKLYAVDDYVVWTDNPGLPNAENIANSNAPASTSTGK